MVSYGIVLHNDFLFLDFTFELLSKNSICYTGSEDSESEDEELPTAIEENGTIYSFPMCITVVKM